MFENKAFTKKSNKKNVKKYLQTASTKDTFIVKTMFFIHIGMNEVSKVIFWSHALCLTRCIEWTVFFSLSSYNRHC